MGGTRGGKRRNRRSVVIAAACDPLRGVGVWRESVRGPEKECVCVCMGVE